MARNSRDISCEHSGSLRPQLTFPNSIGPGRGVSQAPRYQRRISIDMFLMRVRHACIMAVGPRLYPQGLCSRIDGVIARRRVDRYIAREDQLVKEWLLIRAIRRASSRGALLARERLGMTVARRRGEAIVAPRSLRRVLTRGLRRVFLLVLVLA